MFGISGAKAWHYFNWAKENVGAAFCVPPERVGGGLIQQEKRKILKRYARTQR
jgi:hypothetical protein